MDTKNLEKKEQTIKLFYGLAALGMLLLCIFPLFSDAFEVDWFGEGMLLDSNVSENKIAGYFFERTIGAFVMAVGFFFIGRNISDEFLSNRYKMMSYWMLWLAFVLFVLYNALDDVTGKCASLIAGLGPKMFAVILLLSFLVVGGTLAYNFYRLREGIRIKGTKIAFWAFTAMTASIVLATASTAAKQEWLWTFVRIFWDCGAIAGFGALCYAAVAPYKIVEDDDLVEQDEESAEQPTEQPAD